MPTWFIPVALALALAGCHPQEAGQQTAASAAPATGIVTLAPASVRMLGLDTTRLERRPVAVRQEVLGQLVPLPEAEAQVHAPVAGEVTAVHARVGESVRAGAPLLTMRSAERGNAQAAYLKALGEARQAARTLVRMRQLYAAELASKQELDEAGQRNEAAALAVAQASQALRVLGYDDGALAELARRGRVAPELVLRSPRAGTVVERHVALGAAVGPGHEPLFRLLDLSTVRVEADLPERDLVAVRPGQSAQVWPAALGPTQGRVAAIAPTVDPATRSGKALIDVPNPQGQLRPGMSCRVRVETGTRELLLVPISALQEESGKAYVYVPLGEGRFKETPVQPGARLEQGVEVVSGLVPGTAVVTRGSFDLRSEARKASFGGD